ncbi:MAG: glycosyltransferase family 4 protein, partial [Thermodesulfobacteria bacterium]|nr:glycosyltransferase family 4 protein [Thermodesulfobacteriota bacterium]
SYDPFANACLEAMACGVPVVTTAQNGAAELVERICGDFVIPAPRDAYLSEALNHFLDLDESERRALGEASRDLAQEFHWSNHIKGLNRLFSQLVCH